MGLKTLSELKYKSKEISEDNNEKIEEFINKAPLKESLIDDEIPPRSQTIETSRHQDVVTPDKRITIRLNNELHRRWKTFEFNMIQKDKKVSLQSTLTKLLEKHLKKEGF
jgi:hypothetical protein